MPGFGTTANSSCNIYYLPLRMLVTDLKPRRPVSKVRTTRTFSVAAPVPPALTASSQRRDPLHVLGRRGPSRPEDPAQSRAPSPTTAWADINNDGTTDPTCA
jgi:hypothetical protein